MMFFGGFSVIFTFIVFLIIGLIVGTIIKGISQWSKNNSSPMLSVPAVAVSKRMYNAHEHASQYYVTFQFESGDRTEFSVNGRQFGLIAEQDFGKLTFQGTSFISFERM